MTAQEIFQHLYTYKGAQYRIHKSGLPKDVREGISHLCELFERASNAERAQIVSLTRREIAYLFGGFSAEMAIAAVREGEKRFVTLGLVALAIENCVPDWRDSMMALVVLYHSATKLDNDPEKLVRDVAAIAMKSAQDQLFYRFLGWAPEARQLAKFGMKEGRTPEGEFTYVSLR